MNALFTVALFTSLIVFYGADLASPSEAQERGRGDAIAANLAVWHQAAVLWVIQNGGSGYTGAVTQANILARVPSWFQQMQAWQTNVVAGRVTTCLAALPTGFRTGPAASALWKRSHEDVGAGQIMPAGTFVSSSRVGSGLNGPAAGCANGSIAYVSQL